MKIQNGKWMTSRVPSTTANPESGLTLLEVATSVSIFAILVLSVSMTLVRGVQHGRQSFQRYVAMSALRDMVAQMEETANKPEDLQKQEGIGSIYTKYNTRSYSIADLKSGQISVTCYPDEKTVPTKFGGIQDLNFDGDAGDDLGNLSSGTDLRLVPITLTLTFQEDNQTQTVTLDRLITKTAD